MTRPVWPHYWHRVTIPTLVAWHGQYYHITGTVWHFSHNSGMIRPVWPHNWHRETFPTWPFPHKWHDTASITTLLAPCSISRIWYGQYYRITSAVWHFPQKWHDMASMTTLLALCDLSHISGMVRPVWPHHWHCVTFLTLVAWYGQYDLITGTVLPFPH